MTTQNDHKSGRIPMEMLSEFTLKILLSSVFNAFAALAPYPDNWGVGSDIHLMKKKTYFEQVPVYFIQRTPNNEVCPYVSSSLRIGETFDHKSHICWSVCYNELPLCVS